MSFALPLAAPALPLDEAGKYVAACYLVFLALILIYVVIMAIRLAHLERDAIELVELIEARENEADAAAEPDKVEVA